MKVLEMFNSISGEVSPYKQGCLTTFLRLSGCNLSCSYCDTPNAHEDGENWEISKLVPKLMDLYSRTGHLCITGGEPLLQSIELRGVVEYFNQYWIETNGTIDFSGFNNIVADFKLDIMEEIPYYFYNLLGTDFVKFVIQSRDQFDTGVQVQRELQLGGCKAVFAYSPAHKEVSASKLFSWMEEAILPNTIINIQMHKYLGMK